MSKGFYPGNLFLREALYHECMLMPFKRNMGRGTRAVSSYGRASALR